MEKREQPMRETLLARGMKPALIVGGDVRPHQLHKMQVTLGPVHWHVSSKSIGCDSEAVAKIASGAFRVVLILTGLCRTGTITACMAEARRCSVRYVAVRKPGVGAVTRAFTAAHVPLVE